MTEKEKGWIQFHRSIVKKHFKTEGVGPSQIVNENIKFSVCGYSQG